MPRLLASLVCIPVELSIKIRSAVRKNWEGGESPGGKCESQAKLK